MNFLHLSETKLLEGLAQFKFLTNPQIERLGVKKGEANVRMLTKRFMDKYPGVIERVSMGAPSKNGKIPHLYYVTPKGASFIEKALIMDAKDVKHGKRSKIKDDDDSYGFHEYEHRVATIDFFIDLTKWADEKDYNVRSMTGYYEKIGVNKKNRIDILENHFIIPDGVVLMNGGGLDHLCLLEVYMQSSKKNIIGAIHDHRLAMINGSPSDKYGIDRAHSVAIIFEKENKMRSVLAEIRGSRDFKDFLDFNSLFKFRTIADIKNSFYDGWELFDGSKVNFI